MKLTLKRTNIKAAAAVLTALGCVFAADAASPAAPALPDSVNEAAAVMIASNINMAMRDVFAHFRSAGLEIDSAAVVSRVMTLVPGQYDQSVHRAAAQVLASEAARRAARVNDAFLAEAREVPGTQVLPSGVMIRVINEGEGETPSDSATVSFYYEGKLPDGTVFDTVESPAQPLKSEIKNFVPGLTEALGHMRKGGKYEVVIPSELGYGANGAGGVIPPDTPLLFAVELVDFN